MEQGFWWAHMGWIWRTKVEVDPAVVKDTITRCSYGRTFSPSARDTHELCSARGIAGMPWNDPYGGGFVAGFLRLVFQYHCTWVINSVAHTYGFRHYESGGTARLSPWLAISTMERTVTTPPSGSGRLPRRRKMVSPRYCQVVHRAVQRSRFGVSLRSMPESAVHLRAQRKALRTQ